jgi:hypothetical protein
MCCHEQKEKHAHIISLKYHAPLIEYTPIFRIMMTYFLCLRILVWTWFIMYPSSNNCHRKQNPSKKKKKKKQRSGQFKWHRKQNPSKKKKKQRSGQFNWHRKQNPSKKKKKKTKVRAVELTQKTKPIKKKRKSKRPSSWTDIENKTHQKNKSLGSA